MNDDEGGMEKLNELQAIMQGALAPAMGLAMADLPAKLFDFWSKAALALSQLLDTTTPSPGDNPSLRTAVLTHQQMDRVFRLIDVCIRSMELVAQSQPAGRAPDQEEKGDGEPQGS